MGMSASNDTARSEAPSTVRIPARMIKVLEAKNEAFRSRLPITLASAMRLSRISMRRFPGGITGVAAPAQDEPERGKQVDQIGFDERHAGPYDERDQWGSWLACDGVCSVTAELTGIPLSQASQLPH